MFLGAFDPVALGSCRVLSGTWEFPKITATLFWGPYNKDPNYYLGYYIRVPYSRKVSHDGGKMQIDRYRCKKTTALDRLGGKRAALTQLT